MPAVETEHCLNNPAVDFHRLVEERWKALLDTFSHLRHRSYAGCQTENSAATGYCRDPSRANTGKEGMFSQGSTASLVVAQVWTMTILLSAHEKRRL